LSRDIFIIPVTHDYLLKLVEVAQSVTLRGVLVLFTRNFVTSGLVLQGVLVWQALDICVSIGYYDPMVSLLRLMTFVTILLILVGSPLYSFFVCFTSVLMDDLQLLL